MNSHCVIQLHHFPFNNNQAKRVVDEQQKSRSSFFFISGSAIVDSLLRLREQSLRGWFNLTGLA